MRAHLSIEFDTWMLKGISGAVEGLLGKGATVKEAKDDFNRQCAPNEFIAELRLTNAYSLGEEEYAYMSPAEFKAQFEKHRKLIEGVSDVG